MIMRCVTLGLLMLLLIGCVKVNVGTGKAPKQYTYQLSVNLPKGTSKKSITKANLSVLTGTALGPFDNSFFIYRTNKVSEMTDYYHLFISPPANQITAYTIAYLSRSNIFENVLNATNIATETAYTLQPILLSIYANYTKPSHPRAVMSVNFVLYKKPHNKVLMNQVFTEITPLSAKTNQALVTAWNHDLQKILLRLSQRLSIVVRQELNKEAQQRKEKKQQAARKKQQDQSSL